MLRGKFTAPRAERVNLDEILVKIRETVQRIFCCNEMAIQNQQIIQRNLY